uniref:Uncharacterized protein n=1 Tax=Romanomermis culicivorax TaxID=13658 RepID=A0A915KI60_ROMCU
MNPLQVSKIERNTVWISSWRRAFLADVAYWAHKAHRLMRRMGLCGVWAYEIIIVCFWQQAEACHHSST